MTDDPVKPPRFPYVAALLCAACLGAAVWLWMEYSYVWDVTPHDIVAGTPPSGQGGWVGCFVSVRCRARTINPAGTRIFLWWTDSSISERHGGVFPIEVITGLDPRADQQTEWTGRIVHQTDNYLFLAVDTTRSRFTGASIAGLVVGAMGVFVFTVALRHWLNERRAFREEAAGA